MKLNQLLITLSVLFVFASCQKDSEGSLPEPPVAEPLSIAAAKAGDTLFIKGEHFSETLDKNTVQFNGVPATVVFATATELKVLVPANATTGPVTVTVNGQTTTVGNLIINPLRLYSIKSNFLGNTVREVVSIDPATGNESVITTLEDATDYKPEDMVYLPATNELIYIKKGRELIRINLATQQKTNVEVITGTDLEIRELVVDKFSNLYAVRRDWRNANSYRHALIKIDPKTGISAVVKEFVYNPYWEDLVYLAASHEVVGLANSSRDLFKFNLNSKDTATIILHGISNIEYRELAVDSKSRLYAYKGDYSNPGNPIGQIVSLNIVTGQETLEATITENDKLEDQLVFVPQRNEFVGLLSQTSLYRLNMNTKTSSTLQLTTPGNITYNELVSN